MLLPRVCMSGKHKIRSFSFSLSLSSPVSLFSETEREGRRERGRSREEEDEQGRGRRREERGGYQADVGSLGWLACWSTNKNKFTLLVFRNKRG